MWFATKAILTRKCIVTNAYITSEEIHQVKDHKFSKQYMKNTVNHNEMSFSKEFQEHLKMCNSCDAN